MNGTKCSKCGVVNLLSDVFCRRCGSDLWRSVKSGKTIVKGPREAARNSSFLWTLLVLAIVAGGAYYIFLGIERSYTEVNVNEAERTAQPRLPPQLSRSEYEKERTTAPANAIKSSQNLNESQKHNDEIRKMLENGSNKPSK